MGIPVLKKEMFFISEIGSTSLKLLFLVYLMQYKIFIKRNKKCNEKNIHIF